MEEKVQGLWSEPCYIYWHDIDVNGRISFAAIARYLQETAWHSAEELGFGYKRAMEKGQFWALVRQHIQLIRSPRWAEQITLETWPRGIDRLWAFRDYRMRDAQGQVLCNVSSSWMIIDAESRRPQKPEIVFNALPYVLNERALPNDVPKIDWKGNWDLIDERVVRYSDLDFNGHVNNSKYIEWAFDALALKKSLQDFQDLIINYLAEAKENELVRVSIANGDDGVYVKGERMADGRMVFIARLTAGDL